VGQRDRQPFISEPEPSLEPLYTSSNLLGWEKMKMDAFSHVVGVDVSKAKLDVALCENQTVTIKNSNASIVADLIGQIDPESTLVVMEATGGYEKLLVTTLHEHNIPLAVVNPRRVRDCAKGIGKDAKTDPIDAGVLVLFGKVVRPAPQLARSDDEKKLTALVERRRQLLDLIHGKAAIRAIGCIDRNDLRRLANTALPTNSEELRAKP
jgi:transposase